VTGRLSPTRTDTPGMAAPSSALTA
jgi:hypothetical protein